MDPQPVTLEGRHVRLEPLALSHARDLFAAGADDSIWIYMPSPPFRSVDDTCKWIEAAHAAARDGSQIPFATVHRASGRAVGSTRYLDIRRHDRALEIGWTWVGSAHQRTAVNSECKYLLFKHAFEDLGALRVQLKTDARNLRSQRAIERAGGVREGVLRKHMVMWNGFVRDSVYFSVIDDEWPAVKLRLEQMLG